MTSTGFYRTSFICALLLCSSIYWTNGSQISFKSYPSILKANVTDAASMRCALENTEHTRKIVTNTTEDVQHVTSISVTFNDGKDVAHASVFDAPVALTDVGNLQVKGDVTGGSSEGYIQLTWKTPALMSVGQYTCTIDTIDGHRRRTTFEATLELARVEPTLNDLVVLFQQQHLQLSNFQQELKVIKQENADFRQKDAIKTQQINSLTQNLTNQSQNISKLQQCTSPQVAFMAVMTSGKHVAQDTVVTFDKLITDTDGSYNLGSGKFTCKQPGTYLFTLNIITSSRDACVWMNLNSDVVTSAAAWKGDNFFHYESGSASAILQLKQNDVVYAKTALCANGADFMNNRDMNQTNSFSGHLLHPDAC